MVAPRRAAGQPAFAVVADCPDSLDLLADDCEHPDAVAFEAEQSQALCEALALSLAERELEDAEGQLRVWSTATDIRVGDARGREWVLGEDGHFEEMD